MERLAETTPLPPENLLKEFAVKFKSEDVSKPAETNGLAKIQIYRHEIASPTSVLKITIPESPKE
jgi:hypothetical protein